MTDIVNELGLDKGSVWELLEQSAEPQLIADERRRIVFVNHALLTLLGAKSDDVVGQEVETLIPDRFRSRHPSHVRRFIREGGARAMGEGAPLFAQRSDGSEIPVEVSLSRFETPRGRFVLAAVHDITTRKRGEEQFQALLEAAPDALIAVDRERRIRIVNRRCRSLFGYDPAEVLGERIEILIPGRFKERHGEHVAGFFADPTVRLMGNTGLDLVARRKDGSEFPVEISLSPMLGGQAPLVIASVRDMTQRARREEALRTARAEADAANHAKSQFLASMSHELRTPLNGVLGYAQILMRDRELTDDQRDCIQSISSCGEHLLHLINDVLDLAKVEAGALQIERRPCDVRQIVEEVLKIVAPRAERKNLQTRLDVLPDVPLAVMADATRLRQVLINLLGNAAKFTAQGEIGVRVGVRQKHLVLEVHDTGPGIDPAYQATLFNSFRRADTVANVEGAGLGLAISQRLVDAMGGTLTVESAIGRGSSFVVELPLEEAEVPLGGGGEPTSLQGERVWTLEAGTRATVLVVDDIESNRDVLTRVLTAAGFEVVEARDGREAVEQVRRHRPALVFMDMRMPVMNGMDATRAILDDPELADTVIVAITASVFPDARQAMLELGCKEMAGKPFRVPELFEILGRYFEFTTTDAAAAGTQPSNAPRGAAAREISARLRAAVELGDVQEAEKVAGALAEHPTLQGELLGYIHEFDFEEIGKFADRLVPG